MSRALDLDTNLSLERLRALLVYNPDTGIFTWKITRPKCVKGAIAGSKCDDGGWRIGLDGFSYSAHRLAWFYVQGVWPDEEIDHKNRVKSDNRWGNLRPATRVQNQVNVLLKNSTGYANVDKVGKRFRAMARINGKQIHLGMADTAEEAHAISVHARRKVHGEFVISQIEGI